MMVLVIVALLAVGSFAMYGKMMKRSDALACRQNLKNLHAGLLSYINDKHTWPQEPGLDDDPKNGNEPELDEDEDFEWWFHELEPYGVGKESWFCPAELRQLRKAGHSDADLAMRNESSYVPIAMDYGDFEPYRYPDQPWIIESDDFHGDGGLKLMSNGVILKEIGFDALRAANKGRSGK